MQESRIGFGPTNESLEPRLEWIGRNKRFWLSLSVKCCWISMSPLIFDPKDPSVYILYLCSNASLILLRRSHCLGYDMFHVLHMPSPRCHTTLLVSSHISFEVIPLRHSHWMGADQANLAYFILLLFTFCHITFRYHAGHGFNTIKAIITPYKYSSSCSSVSRYPINISLNIGE